MRQKVLRRSKIKHRFRTQSACSKLATGPHQILNNQGNGERKVGWESEFGPPSSRWIGGPGREATMACKVKYTIVTLAVTLLLSGLALAQGYGDDDDDGGYYRGGNQAQAQDYGYQNGYRDGIRKGREEGRENDPFDYQTPDWRQASRGYENWMGPEYAFQRGYRDGYRSGFQAGYENIRGRDYDDDDDHGYRGAGNWNWHDNRGGNDSPAYNIGFRDGSTVAREDIASHKKFNPNPRGRYDDKDHGYRRQYGDKNQYKSQYTVGYRDGYQSNFGGYGRY
jgi:hypothetical protein